jgi:hypothetical protein
MNCGAVHYNSDNAFVFKVGKFVDKNKKIIPFFKAHPIQGVKQLNYPYIFEIATLIGEGPHLTLKGLAKFQLITDRMNTRQRQRKI